jgi:hypothetical protein
MWNRSIRAPPSSTQVTSCRYPHVVDWCSTDSPDDVYIAGHVDRQLFLAVEWEIGIFTGTTFTSIKTLLAGLPADCVMICHWPCILTGVMGKRRCRLLSADWSASSSAAAYKENHQHKKTEDEVKKRPEDRALEIHDAPQGRNRGNGGC